jgi:hypothetical protein
MGAGFPQVGVETARREMGHEQGKETPGRRGRGARGSLESLCRFSPERKSIWKNATSQGVESRCTWDGRMPAAPRSDLASPAVPGWLHKAGGSIIGPPWLARRLPHFSGPLSSAGRDRCCGPQNGQNVGVFVSRKRGWRSRGSGGGVCVLGVCFPSISSTFSALTISPSGGGSGGGSRGNGGADDFPARHHFPHDFPLFVGNWVEEGCPAPRQ